MHCSISGEIPQEPVISKRSGFLFEKRIILKYLEEEGNKCPITGELLEKDDLIPINVNKSIRPRPLQSNSIPGLLSLFQNEWDELMLETYSLKQSLDSTRQELSQALYQHDAACRVIAKLMKERDEARAMLNALQTQGINVNSRQGILENTAENGDDRNDHQDQHQHQHHSNSNSNETQSSGDMEVVPPSSNKLSDDLQSLIMEKCTELSKGRKGRKAPADLTSRESICNFQETEVWTPHESSRSGITSLSVSTHFMEQHQLVSLTGGTDKNAIFTNVNTGQVICKLVGHSKRVNCVAITSHSRPVAITGSLDRQVKVWQPTGDSNSFRYSESLTFAKHENEVTGVAIHPTGGIVASVSKDASWCLNDISRGACLTQQRIAGESSDGFTCSQFHPDGLILATGTEKGLVRLWDIREQQNVATCEGHTAGILALSFNENGYMLASGGADGVAHIWDLRKIKSLSTISAHQNNPVTAVSFDQSGVYLATGGEDGSVAVSVVKEWTSIVQFPQHTKSVTGIAWGEKASCLITSSLDRTLKVRRIHS